MEPEAPFAGPVTPETLPAIWEQVAETVGGVRRERLRLAGAPTLVNAHTVLLKFPAECSLAYEGCAAEATLEVLRNVLRKLTGADMQVRVELLPPDPRTTAAKAARGPSGAVERAKDLMRLPLFAKASQVLGAQLLRVDEGFNPFQAAPLAEVAEPAPEGVVESFAESPAS